MARAICAVAALYILLFASASYAVFSTWGKVERWQSYPKAGDPQNAVHAGDRILAFNGDTRVQHGGLRQYSIRYPDGEPFTLGILRGGRKTELTMRKAIAKAPADGYAALGLLYSLIFAGLSTWIGLMRPDAQMPRLTWLAGMLISGFFLGDAAITPVWRGGFPPGFAAYVLAWVPPWHWVASYWFAAAFPSPAAESAVWRGIRKAVLAVGIVDAVRAAPFTLWSLAIPGEAGMRLATIFTRLPGVFHFPNMYVTMAIGPAIAAVMIRNYRRVKSAGDRRRIRWVAFGVVFGVTADCLMLGLWYLRLIPNRVLDFQNLVFLAIPATMAYAILKYRVLDIRVAVRRGLQYLLARRSLEVLMAAGPAWLAVRGLLHPELTLAQLAQPAGLYASVLAAAALGFLTRDAALRALDRRFFREAWDQERILEGLLDTIRRQFSFENTVKVVRERMAEALHPGSIEILFRAKRGASLATLAGRSIPDEWKFAEMAARRGWVELRSRTLDELTDAENRWLDEGGAEVAIAIPGEDGQATGLMLLGPKKSEEPYTATDLKLLGAIASHLSLAWENHRLTLERMEAVMAERTRMARDLHDTLAQGFAGISLHLETARLALPDSPQEAGGHLEQARAIARASLVEARRSVHDLRDLAREAGDLRARLLELAQQLSSGTAVQVEVESHGKGPLSEAVGRNLFRIAQESITNALKHSGASLIRVTVDFGAAGVSLRVRDNGRGFDLTARDSGGFGLKGMRERAEEIRGQLEVRSAAGDGTEVCVFAQYAAR